MTFPRNYQSGLLRNNNLIFEVWPFALFMEPSYFILWKFVVTVLTGNPVSSIRSKTIVENDV